MSKSSSSVDPSTPFALVDRAWDAVSFPWREPAVRVGLEDLGLALDNLDHAWEVLHNAYPEQSSKLRGDVADLSAQLEKVLRSIPGSGRWPVDPFA